MRPLLFLFIGLYLPLSFYGQDNFDVRTVKNIQANRTPSKTSFYKTMSGSVVPVTGLVPLSMFVIGAIEKDKGLKQKAVYVAGSQFVNVALTFGMKELFDRPRPAEHDPSIIALKDAQNGSFPSGHTSMAFNVATSVSILYPKWYVIVPSHLWASFVGYSRMYLGVHYPSDVLAGAITGSGSAWLSYKLNKWLRQKSNTKKTARLAY